MGLHVAQRPLGRHDRWAADGGKVFHELGWLVSVENKQIVGAGDHALDGRAALKQSCQIGRARLAFFLIALLAIAARAGRRWRSPWAEYTSTGVTQIELAPRRR